MCNTKTVSTLLAVIIIVVLTAGCSAHKNTARSRFWQSFTARYNTYYNGSQAFIDGNLEKEKGNKDNYTEPIPLYTVGNKQSREIGKGQFDRTVEKMEKAIKQHSIKVKPEWTKNRRKTERDKEWLSRHEYNPFIWKAWLLMGKAQFQKGAFDEAAATFAYMSRLYQTQPMQNTLARAWLAKCYTELGWLYDAEDVIRNMSRDSIHYRAQRDWDATMANYYLRNGEQEQALPYLRKVIKHERRRTQKARLYFLLGQTEAALGHRDLAYRAFRKVSAQSPPYELDFNAQIAQTEVMAEGNSKQIISRLKRMARSDNNKDYLDQVYYAMGNIYLLQKDTLEAIAAYEKGREKATRSGIEKGVLLLKLGGIYWDREKYNNAQQCYGEAIGLLDKDRPDYEELSQRSKVLDELVPYTDAVYLQDSLQQLAKLPEKERLEAIDRVIEELKKKEKEERDRQQEAEVEKQLQRQGAAGNRQAGLRQPPTPPTQDKGGQWYFYNQMTVNQGKQQFQKLWGKRENVDNWQRQNQTVVNLAQSDAAAETADADALPTDSLGNPLGELAEGTLEKEDAAEADTLANDPHNREYYLAQIPFTEEQVEASNLIIQDGLFHAGIIFKDKLDNLRLSEKQLLRLTNNFPQFEHMDEAWYHLFLLYSRQGRTSLADACLSHLTADFPESDWTVLLSDPYFVENARFGQHIEDSLYAATYKAFQEDRHDEVAANARLSAERFSLGENRPKFIFIDGMSRLNDGDANGCLEQLKTVVEKYPQSEVTEIAGMIVKGMQEGRTLHGGKFDLGDVWSRRDITLNSATDSTTTDTLSAERNTNFVFLLVYNPDSIGSKFGNSSGVDHRSPRSSDLSPIQSFENQLLYQMARFNFSNFLVRNFDMQIEGENYVHRMLLTGFLNYDEALQYARQLRATAPDALLSLLRHCRTVIISEQNLALLGTRFNYDDYAKFYEQTFVPLDISDVRLLLEPEAVTQPSEEEPSDDSDEGEDFEQQDGGQFNFDDDFF